MTTTHQLRSLCQPKPTQPTSCITDLTTYTPLLRALRIKSKRPVHLTLSRVLINDKAVAALRDLPRWPACLIFDSCEWQEGLFKQAGAALPTSYVFVDLGGKLGADSVRSFCEGVAETRARVERAGDVTVYSGGHEGMGVQVGEHVWLTASERMRSLALYGP